MTSTFPSGVVNAGAPQSKSRRASKTSLTASFMRHLVGTHNCSHLGSTSQHFIGHIYLKIATTRGLIWTGGASGETREIMVTMAAQRGLALPYLRAWRLRRLLTQAELIEKSGVSRTTVVRAESAGGSVSIANIRRLADALGITPDELVYNNPEASSNDPA